LVSCPDRAINGATALDLVTADSELTALGTTIVEMVAECSSVDTELQRFEALKGSTKRFIDVVPPFWRSIATYVFRHHPITGDIVGLLEETGSTTLAELAQTAVETGHPAAESLFRDPDVVTPQAGSQTTDPNRFDDASVYAGCAVYQLKSNLYHAGILTERGADTSALVPKQDYWAIEPSHIDFENANAGGDHYWGPNIPTSRRSWSRRRRRGNTKHSGRYWLGTTDVKSLSGAVRTTGSTTLIDWCPLTV
jgi:hypothetical protein